MDDEQEVAVTILDTRTGERLVKGGCWAYWWKEGDGSCDCNRELGFECADGEEWDENRRYCIGSHRYLVVATDPPVSYGELLEFNSDYPKELTDKYLIAPKG